MKPRPVTVAVDGVAMALLLAGFVGLLRFLADPSFFDAAGSLLLVVGYCLAVRDIERDRSGSSAPLRPVALGAQCRPRRCPQPVPTPRHEERRRRNWAPNPPDKATGPACCHTKRAGRTGVNRSRA